MEHLIKTIYTKIPMIKFKDLLKEVTEYPKAITDLPEDGAKKHWQKEYDKAETEMAKAKVLLRLKDSQKKK